jgi:hypothetical protein
MDIISTGLQIHCTEQWMRYDLNYIQHNDVYCIEHYSWQQTLYIISTCCRNIVERMRHDLNYISVVYCIVH